MEGDRRRAFAVRGAAARAKEHRGESERTPAIDTFKGDCYNLGLNVRSGGNGIYAIIRTGGKQYKVAPGDTVDVERLSAEEGSTVELDDVLLVADEKGTKVGEPTVAGAKVIAEVLGENRDRKIIVFKYKPKVRYRRKKGHRQVHTRLAIKEIVC